MADNTTLVATTVMIAVGCTEARRVVEKKAPTMRPVLGGFALGIFLFLGSMVDAGLGAMFCYLVIVSSLLVNGGPLFTLASKL